MMGDIVPGSEAGGEIVPGSEVMGEIVPGSKVGLRLCRVVE